MRVFEVHPMLNGNCMAVSPKNGSYFEANRNIILTSRAKQIVLMSARQHNKHFSMKAKSFPVKWDGEVLINYPCANPNDAHGLINYINSVIWNSDFMKRFYNCGALSYNFPVKESSVEVTVPTEIPNVFSSEEVKNSVISWLRKNNFKCSVRLYEYKDKWNIVLATKEMSNQRVVFAETDLAYNIYPAKVIRHENVFLNMNNESYEEIANTGDFTPIDRTSVVNHSLLRGALMRKNAPHFLYVSSNGMVYMMEAFKNASGMFLNVGKLVQKEIMELDMIQEIKTKVIKSGVSTIPVIEGDKVTFSIPVDFSLLPIDDKAIIAHIDDELYDKSLFAEVSSPNKRQLDITIKMDNAVGLILK